MKASAEYASITGHVRRIQRVENKGHTFYYLDFDKVEENKNMQTSSKLNSAYVPYFTNNEFDEENLRAIVEAEKITLAQIISHHYNPEKKERFQMIKAGDFTHKTKVNYKRSEDVRYFGHDEGKVIYTYPSESPSLQAQ